jgi:hypothetical protein
MANSTKLWIFTILLIVVNIVGYLVPWGNEKSLQYFSDILPIICSSIAAICLYLTYKAFKEFDYAKKAWLMLLIGISLFFIAETTYLILEVVFNLDMNETFPTIADLFWFAGYIPLIGGISMIFLGYKKSGFPIGNLKLLLLLSFIFFALFAAVIIGLLVPIINDQETETIAKAAYLYYPVADLLLVIPAVLLMYITSLFGRGTISTPWRFLSIGFMLITFADLFYSYLGWRDLYQNGNLIDVAWHVGYIMVGMAGLYQKELSESIQKA